MKEETGVRWLAYVGSGNGFLHALGPGATVPVCGRVPVYGLRESESTILCSRCQRMLVIDAWAEEAV